MVFKVIGVFFSWMGRVVVGVMVMVLEVFIVVGGVVLVGLLRFVGIF